jgi:hypothetical protein
MHVLNTVQGNAIQNAILKSRAAGPGAGPGCQPGVEGFECRRASIRRQSAESYRVNCTSVGHQRHPQQPHRDSSHLNPVATSLCRLVQQERQERQAASGGSYTRGSTLRSREQHPLRSDGSVWYRPACREAPASPRPAWLALRRPGRPAGGDSAALTRGKGRLNLQTFEP